MKKHIFIVLLFSCVFSAKRVSAETPDSAALRAGAENGGMKEQFSYALYLCHNDPAGFEKAMPWFIRADEYGDAVCEYVVAQMLIQKDEGVLPALPWLIKSAAHGFFPAMNRLGELYSRKYSGVEKNYAEAERWFQIASDGGYAPATYNLGVMYLEGLGVPKDTDKAIPLLQRSGTRGMNLLRKNGLIQ